MFITCEMSNEQQVDGIQQKKKQPAKKRRLPKIVELDIFGFLMSPRILSEQVEYSLVTGNLHQQQQAAATAKQHIKQRNINFISQVTFSPHIEDHKGCT